MGVGERIRRMGIIDDRMALHILDDEQFRKRFGKGRERPRTTKAWNATDSEETYRRNLLDPKRKRWLEELGWHDASIRYRYNNHGFRCDVDFQRAGIPQGNMFIGCSITEGVALNIEDTWCHIMGSRLGGPIYNLGQGATGIDCQYRVLRAWGPYLRPRRIFTLGAFGYRREIMRDDGIIEPIGPWSTASALDMLVRFYGNDASRDMHMNLCLDAMKRVCHDNGIELWAAGDGIRGWCSGHEETDRGRDLIHMGCKFHASVGRSEMDQWHRLA